MPDLKHDLQVQGDEATILEFYDLLRSKEGLKFWAKGSWDHHFYGPLGAMFRFATDADAKSAEAVAQLYFGLKKL